MFQLPVDCLNDIIKYLENDKRTLYSCILVNRLWCEVSVRIFWRDINNYSIKNFSTLINCLPDESKKILYDNKIIISTPTTKFPTFNYASFCKVLSIGEVYNKIDRLLSRQQTISSHDLRRYYLNIMVQEIFKMFMCQISSLEKLIFFAYNPTLTFPLYSGAKDCLRNLSKLSFNSSISTELFYQLSQFCYNIQSFTLGIEEIVTNGIVDLISVQRNLKHFVMLLHHNLSINNLTNIIPLLTSKLSNTLIDLDISGGSNHLSLLFIANFSNLKELNLAFDYDECFVNFEKLQYAFFPHLQVLKITEKYPRVELLIKFLEINGKNLKEIRIGDFFGDSDNSLNLAIAKFCPSLRKLSIGIRHNELETLKMIFGSCKSLESIKIWCGGDYLNEKEALELVVKYSQNIHELIFNHLFDVRIKLLPEELESFFISWINRKPQKSISLVIVNFDSHSLDENHENMEIIKKYIKLGVIKRFKITTFDDVEYT
ncbi:hypothetical protein GLOIN_2v1531010 [Rhizophagus clarus]|uniref:F-box domain-containing protein n=2 Tax=Rhizophagus clarus TaxID=94130 RepID=A0A8H3R1T8_9GLOM|nr:hypothetical protein GLOIN_2v1531010 [Rhizophagus clarus]